MALDSGFPRQSLTGGKLCRNDEIFGGWLKHPLLISKLNASGARQHALRCVKAQIYYFLRATLVGSSIFQEKTANAF